MIGGRFRGRTGFIRSGAGKQEGIGRALRDAYSVDELPMEAENAAAIERCIEALEDVESTLVARMDGQKPRRRRD